MNIHDVTSRERNEFAFGLDVPATAKYLRRLADDIENGEILLTEFTLTNSTAIDDFCMLNVLVRGAQKSPSA